MCTGSGRQPLRMASGSSVAAACLLAVLGAALSSSLDVCPWSLLSACAYASHACPLMVLHERVMDELSS